MIIAVAWDVKQQNKQTKKKHQTLNKECEKCDDAIQLNYHDAQQSTSNTSKYPQNMDEILELLSHQLAVKAQAYVQPS